MHSFEELVAYTKVCVGKRDDKWVHLWVGIAVYFDTRIDTVGLLLCLVESTIVVIEQALGLDAF
jgi:hypothetical protein